MAARRLLLFAVLGAVLLAAVAIVAVLALGGSDDDTGAPLQRLPAAGSAPPELPQPEDTGPVTAAPAPPRQPGVIPTGPNVIIARVVDDESGAPVPAFTIKSVPHDGRPALPRLAETPGRPQPTSNPAGIFHLESGKGRWDVVVQAAGYQPGELSDIVVPRPDGKPLELRLSHGPSITGLVYDDQNLGVPDVPVFLSVTKLAGADKPPTVTLARSDAAGRFRFSPLPPGVYAVSVLEPDSADRVTGVALDRGTVEVPLHVSPRHQVVASVRDAEGRPLADAQVELRAAGSIATETSNAAGQARLRFLKPGRYDVRVTHEGFEDLNATLELLGPSGEVVQWYTLRAAP
jgi:hypothetical protein